MKLYEWSFVVCADGIPMGIFTSMDDARKSVELTAKKLDKTFWLSDNNCHVKGKVGQTDIIIQAVRSVCPVAPMWS